MSSSFFLKSGNQFKVSSKEALDIHERLPVATYTIGFNECSGQYYLETIDSFDVKHKLYGNTNRNADRILRTFNDRDVSTGVLLTGEKGSGKTLLAKRISVLAAEQGIPTLVSNSDYCGEGFNGFLQMIEQPVVIVFDEFEKVYSNYRKQEKMLTLLDGVYPSKKLFLLTCNNKWGLNNNLLNRPGRIFYMLDYEGVDQAFIREYCEDNLNVKEHIPKVCAISTVFRTFNFDMLKAMVEEMNRYDETPVEVLQFLNIKPQFDSECSYNFVVKKDNVKEEVGDSEWTGSPLKDPIQIYRLEGKPLYFNAEHLEHVESTTGTYHFVKSDGYRLEMTPVKVSTRLDFEKFGPKPKLSTTAATVSTSSIATDIDVENACQAQSETNSETDSGVLVVNEDVA